MKLLAVLSARARVLSSKMHFLVAVLGSVKGGS